jgi:cystathionine beta-lyase
MITEFDRIVDRTGTSSMKWRKYEGTDIIPMWVADMDFKAPAPVIEALARRIEHGIFGYTLLPERLNEIIVDRMKQLYDWQISTGDILWLPGVVSSLNTCCAAFGRKNRPVMTTVPIYPPFLSAPGNNGLSLQTVPLTLKNQRATLDFDAIETGFRQGVSLFMLCSPYNPGGTIFSRDELERLTALCEQYDIMICSDEIHADFILDKGNHHLPTAAVSDQAAARTVTLMAPSKTYNIPGLGASFAIITDKTVRETFKQKTRGLIPEVNLLGLAAAEAAYSRGDDWLKDLIIYLRGNRDLVFDRVNQMRGCTLNPIAATYLAWIDVRQTGLEDPVSFFENTGVGLSDGAYFGCKGFVRLNFGCPRPVLEKGLRRMAEGLDKLS